MDFSSSSSDSSGGGRGSVRACRGRGGGGGGGGEGDSSGSSSSSLSPVTSGYSSYDLLDSVDREPGNISFGKGKRVYPSVLSFDLFISREPKNMSRAPNI